MCVTYPPMRAPMGDKDIDMNLVDALADHPSRKTFDLPELLRAIEACQQCSTACTICADSDLARGEPDMNSCIRSCLDTATICDATTKILARPTPGGDAWMAQVNACIAAAKECAEICAEHDQICCVACAEACRECQRSLQQLVAAATTSA